MMDEQAEDELEQAYADPIKHSRIERLRQQAWRVVLILQDSSMRPDEVFPMRIENFYWNQNRIWVPGGQDRYTQTKSPIYKPREACVPLSR
jgi:hypothetical protein